MAIAAAVTTTTGSLAAVDFADTNFMDTMANSVTTKADTSANSVMVAETDSTATIARDFTVNTVDYATTVEVVVVTVTAICTETGFAGKV